MQPTVGDMHRRPRRPEAASLVVLLMVSASLAGCTPAAGDDEAVTGAEWKTTVRRAVGAASAADPSRLTGVTAEDHGGYDRIVFTFDGERPGYRAGYAGTGGDQLSIVLSHTTSPAARQVSPELAVVAEVRHRPTADGTVDATVRLETGDAVTRLPFRVGLAVGEFYVDVAHPDRVPEDH